MMGETIAATAATRAAITVGFVSINQFIESPHFGVILSQQTHSTQGVKMNNTFFWFHFMDGYKVCVRGFSRIELEHEELRHGKLIRMVAA
jgi:hypothetical protein